MNNQTMSVMFKLLGDASSLLKALQSGQNALGRFGSILKGSLTGSANASTAALGKVASSARTVASVLMSVFGKTQQAASSLGDTADSVKSRLAGIFQVAGGNLLAQGISAIGGAFRGLATSVIGTNSTLQDSATSWEVLLGSMSAAQDQLGILNKFAATTPFEFGEVDQASKLLQTFGGAALNTVDTLTLVGDVASGVNQPFSDVSMWVGRMYDAIQSGKPFGEAAARLQEMGAMSGVTRTQLEDMQAQGVSGDKIWSAFTDSMGRFGGMMEKQAQNWSGLKSTFFDTLNLLAATAGKPIFDRLSAGLSKVNALLADESFSKGAERFAEVLGQGLDAAAAVVTSNVIPALMSLWNVVQLLMTGDFQGGIFGLAEDSPAIAALFVMRDAALALWGAFTGQGDTLGQIGLLYESITFLGEAFGASEETARAWAAEIANVFAIIGVLGETVRTTFSEILTALGEGDFAGAFDSLTEGLSNLGIIFTESIVPVLTDVGTALLDAVMEWGPVVTSAIAETLLPAFASIGTNVQGSLLPALEGVAEQLLGVVQTWAPILGQWVIDGIPLLLEHLAASREAMMSWVSETLPVLLEGFGQFVAPAAQWLLDAVPVLGANAVTFFQAIINQTVTYLPQWAASLAQFGIAAVSWIAERLPDLANNLGQLSNTMITWVVGMLPTWGAQLAALGAKVAGWVLEALPGLGTNLGQAAGVLLSWVAQTAATVVPQLAVLGLKFIGWVATTVLPALPGALATIAVALFNFITALIGQVGPKLVELGTSFHSWVTTVVLPALPGKLNAISSAIFGWLNATAASVFSTANEVGASLVNGIIAGLGNLAALVRERVTSGISGGIAGVKAFFGIKSPSKYTADQIGLPLGQGIPVGFAKAMPKARQELVASLADLMSKVAGAVSDMVAALQTLSGYDEGALFEDAIGGFASDVERVIAALAGIAAKFKAKAVEMAATFAENAQKVFALVASGVEALAALATYDEGALFEDAVYGFAEDVGRVVEAIARVASQFKARGVEMAAVFSDNAAKVLSLVSNGVESLFKLREYDPDSLYEDVIYGFATDVARVVEAVIAAASAIASDGLTAAGVFADIAAKVLALVSSGVEALVALRSYDADSLYEDVVYGFAADVVRVVQAVAEAAALLSEDAVVAAVALAEGAGKVIALIGPAVDAIGKLGELRHIPDLALQLLAEGIELAVQKLADLAANFDIEGVQAAAAFAEAVAKIIAPIGAAVQAFTDLREYKGILPWMLDMLGADIRLAVAKMVDMATKFAVEGVQAATEFSQSVGVVFTALKTVLDTLTALGEYKGVASLAIAAFQNDFYGVLGMLQGLAATALASLEQVIDWRDAIVAISDAITEGIEMVQALNATEIAEGLETTVAETATDTESAGATISLTLIEGIIRGFDEAQSDFYSHVASFFNALGQQAIAPMLDATERKFEASGGMMAANLGDALNEGQGTVRNAGVGLGNAAGDGVASGIRARIKSIAAAAIEAAKAAVAAAKAALGVASPSTVMRDEVGVPFGQGFEQGAVASLMSAATTIRDTFSGVVNSLVGIWRDADWSAFSRITDFVTDAITDLVEKGRIAADDARRIVTGDDAGGPGVNDLVDDVLEEIRRTGEVNADALGRIQDLLGEQGQEIFAQLKDRFESLALEQQIGALEDQLKGLDSPEARKAGATDLEPLRKALEQAEKANDEAQDQERRAKERLSTFERSRPEFRTSQEKRAYEEQLTIMQAATRAAEERARVSEQSIKDTKKALEDAEEKQKQILEDQKAALNSQIDMLKQRQVLVDDHLAGLEAIQSYYEREVKFLERLIELEAKRNETKGKKNRSKGEKSTAAASTASTTATATALNFNPFLETVQGLIGNLPTNTPSFDFSILSAMTEAMRAQVERPMVNVSVPSVATQGGMSGGARGGITIHSNPTIVFQGGTSLSETQVERAVKNGIDQALEELWIEIERELERKA